MSDMNDDFGDEPSDGTFTDEELGTGLLEEELRQAAAILDPVPAGLRQIAVDAFALHDLEARVAELTFDSLVDAIPVRGETDPPRMLTFRADEVTVDVEVTRGRSDRPGAAAGADPDRGAERSAGPCAADGGRHGPVHRRRLTHRPVRAAAADRPGGGRDGWLRA